MDLHKELSDPRRYERRIDRLHARYLSTKQLYELQQSDVSLAEIVLRRRKVAKLLAKDVGKGRYQSQPAQVRRIHTKGKERTAYSYRLTDLIVHATVADLIEELAEPQFSPRLFSYRKGVSWWSPVSELAEYVRRHRAETPDVRRRGLYVVKRDVRKYVENVPTDTTSPLWPLVFDLLDPDRRGIRPADRRLVETVVRPTIDSGEGPFCTLRGLALGQPIASVLSNLYLLALDRELEAVGGFYARYCDDFLFAHPDAGVVQKASQLIDDVLEAHRLQSHPDKREDLYLTAAGRRSDAWPEARGAQTVAFLGMRVGADGTVGLGDEKVRVLLRDVERRARRAARAVRTKDLDERGRVVCRVVNEALDPDNDTLEESAAAPLRRTVTDRRQLEQLDYQLARIVAGIVTGDDSPKAFRTVSYAKMRRRWGLISLVQARNTVGRATR